MPRARVLRSLRPARVLAAAALALATAGCGSYHVVRTDAGLGAIRRVAVQTFENQSYEPGIEVMVSEAFRREFEGDGVVLASDPAHADLVLSGAVLELTTTPRSFSSVGFGLEYQVEMRLAMTARRSDGSVIPVDAHALRDWELYLTSADVEAEHKNRDEALRRLSTVLAERTREFLADRLAR